MTSEETLKLVRKHVTKAEVKKEIPSIGTVFMRLSTLDDFEAILRIGTDLFDGLDYLPAQYPRLLSDPSYIGIVYILNGEIVCFSSMNFMDNCTTFFGRSGRLHPHAQGRKIFRLLSDMMSAFNDVLSELSISVDILYGTWKITGPVLKSQAHWMIHVKLFVRECTTYKFDKTEYPHSKPQSHDSHVTSIPSHVTRIEEQQMGDIIMDETIFNKLFLSGFVQARFVFFKPSRENLKMLYHLKPVILGSFKETTPTCLTIGIHYPCHAGYAYHVECFGDDISELEHHISYHIMIAKDISAQNIYFHVFSDDRRTHTEIVDKTVIVNGGHPHKLSYDGYVAGYRRFDVEAHSEGDPRVQPKSM